MVNIDIILSFICSLIGIIFGFIFRKYYERKVNYYKKHDELVLDTEIENLKDKLNIYWAIYFKLLKCQSVNIQLKKNNIKYNEIIIKELDDIIDIISKNIQKMDIDTLLLDLIVQLTTHVLSYKLNNNNEYPFPDRFTIEITNRTFKYQSLFNKYIKNPNIEILTTDIEFKDKIKIINNHIIQSNHIINPIHIDDDDLDIECNIDDINLEAIFDNCKKIL